MGRAANLASLGDLTFKTSEASVTSTTGVATTLFTLSSATFATYLLTVGLHANDTTNYHEVAIIVQQGSNLAVTTLVNSSLTAISVSGLNIQGTQSSGATQPLKGFLTCLNKVA